MAPRTTGEARLEILLRKNERNSAPMSFRTLDQLRNPTILEWCDRVLLDRLRALDEDALRAALGGSLTRWEIQGLAARARLIVKHFDDRSAERGEGSVLFDWLQP